MYVYQPFRCTSKAHLIWGCSNLQELFVHLLITWMQPKNFICWYMHSKWTKSNTLKLPKIQYTKCNLKLGYINFWVSLIKEVGCWLVEPFVSMTAAFTLLLHGKLCWFGREVMHWEICMAAALNGYGACVAAPNYG